MVVSTILKFAECKNPRGMRYETNWLIHCIVFHTKSPAAYEHLKNNGILPLPHRSTLQRLLSYAPCEFGFNSMALGAIKTRMNKWSRAMRYGSLIWDEMSLSQDVNFNSQQLRMDGFMDLGGEIHLDSSKQQLVADHALVFLFRPYRARWIQPIAVFATKGAASADVLHVLIMKAICMLEKHNARVVNVVSDGAQTNKSAYAKFGISGKLNDVTNCIDHPLDDKEKQDPSDIKPKIYFLYDVPHLFKTIRNHIFKHKEIQVYVPEFIFT